VRAVGWLEGEVQEWLKGHIRISRPKCKRGSIALLSLPDRREACRHVWRWIIRSSTAT
jgi:hypothetical protein